MRLLDLPLTRQGRLPVLLTLLVGIALPFLVITLVPYYHTEDLAAFSGWAACLDDFGRDVYLLCGADRSIVALNYPSVGLILSGGVMGALRKFAGGDPAATSAFRFYIAAFASASFVLLALLGRAMRLASWAGVALLILVMPSTLVGGILWGQLDGVSLVFCLVAFLGLWGAWRAAERGQLWAIAGRMAVGTGGLGVLLLIKPLNTFALPFFAFFVFLVLVRTWRTLRVPGIAVLAVLGPVAVGVFRYLDTRFAVASGFWSSTFWYSWTGGVSPQGDVIAGNGFNLWVLLGRDMWSSSRAPFADLSLAGRPFILAPRQTGIALFGLFLVASVAVALYAFWPRLRGPAGRAKTTSDGAMSSERPSDEWPLPLLCLLFALTQIGFNVLLTGTHERYLFLGYPFLLISTLWLATRHVVIGWRGALGCWAVAFLNGLFVYGAMHPLPGWLFAVWNPAFQATLHMVLLVYVFGIFWRAARMAHATASV